MHTISEYDRLEQIATEYWGTLGKLAVQMGKSHAFFYTYKGKSKFGRKILQELENVGINTEYIKTGNGNLFAVNEAGVKLSNENTSTTKQVKSDNETVLKEVRVLTLAVQQMASDMQHLKTEVDMLKLKVQIQESEEEVELTGETEKASNLVKFRKPNSLTAVAATPVKRQDD
jgi:hypothetical protein